MSEPKFYDVTAPLCATTPGYPGDPSFEMRFYRSLAGGDPYNLASLTLGTHTGTHVDAPYHFFDGAATVDELPLEILLGKARVVDLPAQESIERAELEALDLHDDLRLLIKTRGSGPLRGSGEDAAYLTAGAAHYLTQAGLKLVGIDVLSVDPYGGADFPAHRALLGAGVVIVEGLELGEVEPGEYEMVCLPLKLVGADGAPTRVILRSRP